MKDFIWDNPTRILFGHQAEEQVGKLTASYGKKAMILYGSGRIRQNGLLDRIEQRLREEGVRIETFSGITENPELSVVEEISEIVRSKGIEVLLAVGGGSIIDTAKAVSIGSCNPEPVWDFFTQKAEPKHALPVGVVLTMAATASEANSCAVITNGRIGRKTAYEHPLLYPKFALMNPELTESVPPAQTAAGAVDIFAHAFERYFDRTEYGTLRRLLCTAVMRTVQIELPKALAHPEDYDTRSQLMWAATMAHSNRIGFGGVFACHEMSHILTERFGIRHGVALAILMPAWLKYMMIPFPKEIAEFASDVFDIPTEGRPSLDVAQDGISAFQHFLNQNGLPVTLKDAGIQSSDSRELAEELLGGTGTIGENFSKLGSTEVQDIFELCKG